MNIVENAPWAIWIIVLPLISAALAFLFPRRAVFFGLIPAVFLPPLVVALAYQVMHKGARHYLIGGWGASLGIDLYTHGLGVFMLLMTSLVGSVISFYSIGYFSRRPGLTKEAENQLLHRREFFWPLWNFLWAALNALFLSADIFNLYITLELVGLSAVALIALEGGSVTLIASMRYLLVNLLGGLFYLIGVGLLYSVYSTVDMTTLSRLVNPQDMIVNIALGLMTMGLLLKTGLFPLHFWLPSAHANALAPVSAILSALVIKAPFYLLLRLWFDVFSSIDTVPASQLLGILGGGAIVWGSVYALKQKRLKLLVAYSTVAQLGYLFLVFPLAGGSSPNFRAWSGAIIYAFAHACAKAAMFLSSGTIQFVAGSDFITELEGVNKQVAISLFAFGLAGVSLMGLPHTGGFLGKWLLLTQAINQQQWWWIAFLITGALLTALYLFKVINRAFSRAPQVTSGFSVPAVMQWSPLFLSFVALALGLVGPATISLLRIGSRFALSSVTGGAP